MNKSIAVISDMSKLVASCADNHIVMVVFNNDRFQVRGNHFQLICMMKRMLLLVMVGKVEPGE